MIDVYLYPSAVPIEDIILSDPLRARSLILGRDDKPRARRREFVRRPPRPVVAKSLMADLIARYGAGNGQRIYFAMERERKGPFGEERKYDAERRGIPPIPPIKIGGCGFVIGCGLFNGSPSW